MRSNELIRLMVQAKDVFEDGRINFSNAAASKEDFQKPYIQDNTMVTFGSINSKENERALSFKKRELENSNAEQSEVHDKVRKLEKLKSLETEEDGDHKYLDAAIIKLQKVYTSYRTQQNLADCAVVVEEIGWKELDSAALTRSSVSFFNPRKAETGISRWRRTRILAANVGKGLLKDEEAQTLAETHWLEAIDPHHRYGHNLNLYHNIWFASESTQPFFYWLNIGDGKEVNLETCPRTDLQHQCVKYLGPKERKAYEVVVESGKLLYRKTRVSVNTSEGSKWLFVLSTSRNLYVGEKKKGFFQHSSFLAGGATSSSGRLLARNGILEAIWPFSGHYRPTEENFNQFCNFLKDHQVDLTNVKKYALDDDIPPKVRSENNDLKLGSSSSSEDMEANAQAKKEEDQKLNNKSNNSEAEAVVEFDKKSLSQKWLRDYPKYQQFHALDQQVNFSPKIKRTSHITGLVPSPIRGPKFLLSPRLACLALDPVYP